jgi:tetratricopeptide (TPR) repeat protein
VEFLNRQMEREGKTSHLLYQRATEYRALGRLDEAARDLEDALSLEPGFLSAQSELSRVYLAMNKPEQALRILDRSLDTITNDLARAPLYMARAEVCLALGEDRKALVDCDRALAARGDDLDGYLMRSRVQSRMGRHRDAVRDLRDGFEKTGSGVLEIAWIEALIDAGDCERALREIAPQLEACRWKSSWLLRRGRARLGLAMTDEAHADLRKAIREIDQRLNPDRPDIIMLAERGLAFFLLGDQALARQDYRFALSCGAETWMLYRLGDALQRVP